MPAERCVGEHSGFFSTTNSLNSTQYSLRPAQILVRVSTEKELVTICMHPPDSIGPAWYLVHLADLNIWILALIIANRVC